MIIAFEVEKLIFFIKFVIIEFEFTIINLMSRVFFVFELFQKKTIEIIFLKVSMFFLISEIMTLKVQIS